MSRRLKRIEKARQVLVLEASKKEVPKDMQWWLVDICKHLDPALIPLHKPKRYNKQMWTYMRRLVIDGWDRSGTISV